MSIIHQSSSSEAEVEELHSGDRMTREEFHKIYERMPEDFKAELIGGTVYVASPLRLGHGTIHVAMSALLFNYQARTPGVQVGDNITLMLADDCEPQPDLFVRVEPGFGGQSQTTPDDYIQGPPELLIEIAHSSRSLDLNAKRQDYARYHVLEYIVVSPRDQKLRWFNLPADREQSVNADGVLRATTFPGLWIHEQALLNGDHKAMMETLNEGLASPEHAAFVQRLALSNNKV